MIPSDSAPTINYYLGLDLGQTSDFTALVVLEQTTDAAMTEPFKYVCRHLHRWHLGTPYPVIVESVARMLLPSGTGTAPSKLEGARLVVDATGVGRAVVDMFRQAVPETSIVPIIITGGLVNSYDSESRSRHVAKKELVGVLQVLLQTRRLKVASALPEAKTLVHELANFKVKITTAGNETFESWRERDHDDLVLALACALWYAEKYPPCQYIVEEHEPNVVERGIAAGVFLDPHIWGSGGF